MIRKLNFGCGNDIREGWDNCDIQKIPGLVYCNANKFPYPFKDNTYDFILLKEVLEYFDKPFEVLLELRRISKNNAVIEIEVPYYNNKGAYNDFQVNHYFNDTSFRLMISQNYKFKQEKQFEIISIKLLPTSVGKFLPKKMIKYLSLFIGGLIGKIRVELKVIK